MKRTFNLVLQDHNEPGASFVVTFDVRGDVASPEDALRGVVKDFLASGSKELDDALKGSRHLLDWGDALCRIPDSFFEKRGLWRWETQAESCFVDYYEILDKPSDGTGESR
jgi:hypothetical protein